MSTYVGLFKLTPVALERLPKTPEHEGGTVAVMRRGSTWPLSSIRSRRSPSA